MTQGVSPRGTHYLPAFPHRSFRSMPLEGVSDLHAYLASLPAVGQVLGPDGDGMGNTFPDGSGIALDPTGKLYVGGASSANVFEIVLEEASPAAVPATRPAPPGLRSRMREAGA